jgi:hypothetical protein
VLILHWLNSEYWGVSWPNIFAPSVWTVLAIVVSHIRASRQRERQQAELKQHVTDTHAGKPGSEAR